jgi:outer membrane protein
VVCLSRLLSILSLVTSIIAFECYGCQSSECIKKHKWQVGVALGAGIKTNPLVDGDHIPLIIVPDIAWYSEYFYFDNGEFGWQLRNHSAYSVSAYIRPDDERAFFSFVHPTNLFVGSNSSPTNSLMDRDEERFIQDSPKEELSIDDITKRKWAINAGVLLRIYTKHNQFNLSAEQDISGTHHGYRASLSIRSHYAYRDTQMSIELGLNWKNHNLINYYYGVNSQDTDQTSLFYSANGGIESYISANFQKPINDKWLWLANLGYRKVSKAQVDSPIVKRNFVMKLFLGVGYRF